MISGFNLENFWNCLIWVELFSGYDRLIIFILDSACVQVNGTDTNDGCTVARTSQFPPETIPKPTIQPTEPLAPSSKTLFMFKLYNKIVLKVKD